MPFNLNQAPTTKPDVSSNFQIEDGVHLCTVEKVEYANSSNGNPMLSLRFKDVATGTFIFDQIMDDQTKPMNIYKLSRLIKALNLTPTGSVELRDMTKIIRTGSRLNIAVINVKRGTNNYVNVDFTNSFEGYYPVNNSPVENVPAQKQDVPAAAPQPNLNIAENDDMY